MRFDEKLEVRILLVGGKATGKSSLMHRFMQEEFLIDYIPSENMSTALFECKMFGNQSMDSILVRLIDISSSYATSCFDPIKNDETAIACLELRQLIESAHGMIFVVDVMSLESLRAVDDWMSFLVDNLSSKVINLLPKIIFVNKADLMVSGGKCVITPTMLDAFVMSEGFTSWAYTVSSPSLIDFDPSRSHHWDKCKSPETMLYFLIRCACRKYYNLKSIAPVPNQAMNLLWYE